MSSNADSSALNASTKSVIPKLPNSTIKASTSRFGQSTDGFKALRISLNADLKPSKSGTPKFASQSKLAHVTFGQSKDRKSILEIKSRDEKMLKKSSTKLPKASRLSSAPRSPRISPKASVTKSIPEKSTDMSGRLSPKFEKSNPEPLN